MRIPDTGSVVFHPRSRIQGSKKHRIRIRNTGLLPGLRIRIHFYAEANADSNFEAHAFSVKEVPYGIGR
jgi:hypothetical protein